MKKQLLGFVVAGCLAAVGDSLWIGGASGNWNDVNNWSGAVVPNGADAVARIESASDVTISVGNGTYTVGAIYASGGNHKIDGGVGSIRFASTSGTGVVDVAENVKLTAYCHLDASVARGAALAKTGLGTFFTTNQVGTARVFNGIDVREGDFDFSNVKHHTDHVNPGGLLTIRSGATAHVRFQNLLKNDTVIDIEEGGTFDAHGNGDLITAIVGKGAVLNCGTTRLGLKGGPHTFCGQVTGTIQLYRITSTTDVGYEPDDSKRLWILGTREGLANADISFSTNALVGDRLLSFAPGLGGEFKVKHIDFTHDQPLVLEDTEGNPVTVRTTPGATALKSGRIVGSGSFTLVSGANTNIAQTNDMVTALGTYGWTAGTNTFGNGVAAHDAVVTSLAAVDVPKGAVLVRRNATNETWDTTELIGMGTVIQDAPSDWSLPLSMTGGTFRVTARAGANEVTFSGGNSTNVTLDLSAAPAARIAFTGGTHHFPVLSGEATRTYRQTGGTVYAGPLSGHVSVASQSDIFYTMTGGTLYSTTLNNYARGLGLDMSGDAKAYLRFGGGNKMYHRLASDGESHTIRLRDNALLDVDWMHLATQSTAAQTSTFDLQGGTLQVNQSLSLLQYNVNKYNYTGSFIFNGGRLRPTLQDSWCVWGFNDRVTAFIGPNGARFDVPRDHWGRSFYFQVPLLTGVADGVDGGVEKTGTGWLVVYKTATYTGPTRVLGGSIRTSDETGAAPFGTGSVELENGTLLVTTATNDQKIATASGATVTYRGGSLLGTYSAIVGQVLTVGPADATPGSVLVRDGHGVLAIFPRGVTGKTLGGDHKFKVNGGMPLDSYTGLVAAPVFAYLNGASSGWWFLTFLTYDDNVGFKEPAYTEGLGGGNTSVARISTAPVTVTADTHVGALDLRYLNGKKSAGGVSIASGATLTVGNGAGTLAPILMNNYNNSDPSAYQSIIGAGSLDFGAAEGLVACNLNRYYFSNDSWYLANRIACKIKGTGGVTFAGMAEHANHSDLELSAANEYTGGTWIEHLCVRPMVDGALSSGPVTVDGNMTTGGGIWIPSVSTMTTLPNALTLSGTGRFTDLGTSKNLLEMFGALRADRTVNVTGAISLPADTRISAFKDTTRLTLSGGVSGAGKLIVSGSGTVILPTANGYAGGTTVEGILEVQDAAALGTGPVTVTKDGTLRFANASPLTIANAISGEGTIEFAGSAPVTLSAADGFTGTRRATGGVTTAGYDLVKDGDDTMVMTGANTYGGETRVLGGTLALGPQPAETLPCPEAISLRLDADDASSRTMNGNNVVAWADADGRGISFTNNTETAPILNVEAINGKNTVFFGGLLNRMVSDKGVAARAVFIVNKFQPKGTTHPNTTVGKSGWTCAGIFGDAGADCGIRVDSASSGVWRTDDWTMYGDIYCNGVLTKSFLWDAPQVTTFTMATLHDATRVAVGDYWGSTQYYRGFFGDVAEVLVYNRSLTEEERQAVEAYLGAKWRIAVSPVGVATNVLPVATDVMVADGAALDLAGRVQTVASIAGAGAVTNSSLAQATLTLGSLDGFTGTLAGNILLDVRGTTTLAADATIDPGIDLHLAPGTILDLGGRTVTVRNASGNGVVRNGTLIVTGQDNRLSPATMIIFR